MSLRDELMAAEDAAIARFRAELVAVVQRIRAELARIIADTPIEEGAGFAREVRVELLARLEAQWSAILAEAGWSDAVENLATSLEDVLARIGVAAGADTGIGDVMAELSPGELRAMLGNLLDDLIQLATTDGRAALRRVIIEGDVPGDRGALVDALASAIGGTASQAVSLADTTAMGLDRALTVQIAQSAGFTLYLYAGPDDVLTRPYCEPRVGKVLTLEELDSEENDTGPQPPSRFGGGWNCRHRLVPVDAEDAAQYERWSP